jgi:hypothetical protein
VLSRAVLAAVRPTARVSSLGPAAATVAFGAAPTLIAVAAGSRSLAVPAVVAGLAAGAALGWVAADPAAEVLAPLPVTAPSRTVVRAVLVALVATAVSAGLLMIVWLGPGVPSDLADRVPEAASAGAVALAVGLVLARRGDRAPAAAAVAAGLGIPLFIAALAVRWPGSLPTFDPGPRHDRWWLVVAVAVPIALRAGRDPARRW